LTPDVEIESNREVDAQLLQAVRMLLYQDPFGPGARISPLMPDIT
jgi:hypothetical protein